MQLALSIPMPNNFPFRLEGQQSLSFGQLEYLSIDVRGFGVPEPELSLVLWLINASPQISHLEVDFGIPCNSPEPVPEGVIRKTAQALQSRATLTSLILRSDLPLHIAQSIPKMLGLKLLVFNTFRDLPNIEGIVGSIQPSCRVKAEHLEWSLWERFLVETLCPEVHQRYKKKGWIA